MGFADIYLGKQKGFIPCFRDLPSPSLQISVVIPAFREPHVIRSLESLFTCTLPASHAEVIIVPNRPESADVAVRDQTRHMMSEISGWIGEHTRPGLRFLLMPEQIMPDRDAGVGLARKTGMDQALARFNILNRPHGLVVCFDADSLCSPNYFTALEETLRFPRMPGFNLYFEHPLSGNEPESIYHAIAGYELHLRYMNLFCRYTGFPYAYHTIGSCFGVRAETYAREGGMNKRKAGEDFYFLHKVIPLGGFREVNTTCVYPSPRISDRVPFGTGAAMGKYIRDRKEVMTYSPKCYKILKMLFDSVPAFYDAGRNRIIEILNSLPEPLRQYLAENNAEDAIREARANSASASSFSSRFYSWFNAFRIIKFLNYATLHTFGQTDIREAAIDCLQTTGFPVEASASTGELLKEFRRIEKER
jgi:glycosyltransferase involved in cell wall biosynthesis